MQPSELAKLSAIFFIAALLERRMDRIDEIPHALVPIGVVVGGLVGLILLEPDLGTAMTLLLIAVSMVFAAGLSYRYVVGAILCGLPVIYFILMSAAYRRRRLMAFWDPWSDPLGDGFQVIQSLIAVGSGGLIGRGFMSGVQKLFYLPEPHTDFIYAVIGEEFGLLGTTIVLACFVVIAWRGFKIAMQAPDRFGAFLAIGLTTMIAAQAFFNISVVLGLVPTKGIPLPFVSNGGSSLLISLLGMGILLNVSQHAAPGIVSGGRSAVRVVIAGGGTGGHLFPGLAVARALKARMPDAQISFAGTAAGIEARVIPSTEFALDLIRSAGLKGKSLARACAGAALVPLGGVDAWRVISRRRPDVVIGVGGYSSGPVVAVAAMRGIPTMVLEQNAVPGLTNRLLAPFVRRAAVTYDASLKYFGEKAFVSGNPVRREFLEVDDDPSHDAAINASRVRVLVFGGSQGAHAINMAMVEAAPRLAAAAETVDLVCQTGTRDFDMVRAAFERHGVQGRVERFIDAMDREMKAAGLVVSRAGATTLAEVTAAGRPAILIPLPTATDDHQRHNARALETAGAAEVMEQSDLTGERLADRIIALAGDRERRRRMSAAARQLAKPRAAEEIVDAVIELAERRRS